MCEKNEDNTHLFLVDPLTIRSHASKHFSVANLSHKPTKSDRNLWVLTNFAQPLIEISKVQDLVVITDMYYVVTDCGKITRMSADPS